MSFFISKHSDVSCVIRLDSIIAVVGPNRPGGDMDYYLTKIVLEHGSVLEMTYHIDSKFSNAAELAHAEYTKLIEELNAHSITNVVN